MIKTEKLPDGRVKVTSTEGYVDIGAGPVKAIICTEDEVKLVAEAEDTEE